MFPSRETETNPGETSGGVVGVQVLRVPYPSPEPTSTTGQSEEGTEGEVSHVRSRTLTPDIEGSCV